MGALFTKVVASILMMLMAASGSTINNDVSVENQGKEIIQGDKVSYSNLADKERQNLCQGALNGASISQARQKVFFDHVKQFNQIVGDKELAKAFEVGKITETKYDPFAMGELWQKKQPNFMGYNCRITAYSLFGDNLSLGAGKIPQKSENGILDFDLIALKQDKSAMVGKKDLEGFKALYTEVPTMLTKDKNIHLKNMQKAWQQRGLSFKKNSKVSLISFVIHDQAEEEKSYLFIGHVGLLFPKEDGGFYFVEKVAFQEPYRLNDFPSKEALHDYLMGKYDIDFNQETARPFIMENDQLMVVQMGEQVIFLKKL